MPILALDRQLDVVEANWAAKSLFSKGAGFQTGHSCGETIRCFYKFESGKRCGQTVHCSNCVIRAAVTNVFLEEQVIRKRSQMYIQRDGYAEEINFLMTAWPVIAGDFKYAMVMMEDLTDLFQLGQILPMCAACKKIKIAENTWETVEKYISRHLGLDLSHGICAECRKKLYPDLEE